MVVVGSLGLCGCWQQSANKLIITAALQLVTALFGACAMATWHAALFFEMEKVHDDDFPLTWPDWLQQTRAAARNSAAGLLPWRWGARLPGVAAAVGAVGGGGLRPWAA